MNEKYLWELWAKCKHPHPKYGGGDMVWPMEFAELIVAKMLQTCEDHPGWSGRMIGEQIKQDFGVGE